MARAHFVEAVLLRLYRLDDPVPFLLYVVDLVCLVLHVRVVNITVFCYGLVSDLFVRPWLGRTWFLETVCTLYVELNQNGVFCHLMNSYVTSHVLWACDPHFSM